MKFFIKRYNLKVGLIISFLAAVIVSTPKIAISEESSLILELLKSFLYNFIFVTICWLINSWILQKVRNRSPYVVGVVGIICCAFWALIIYVFTYILLDNSNNFLINKNLLQQLDFRGVLLVQLVRGATIGGIVFFIVYHFNVLIQNQEAKAKNEKLERDQLTSKVNALEQQLSPHFFFNALSTLKAIATDQNIKTYIVKLSSIYRYMLRIEENHVVALADELEIVEAYWYIQEQRFGDGIQLTMDISDEARKLNVPPMAVQMLLENAIKHNTTSIQRPLRISITTGEKYLEVKNELQLKPGDTSSTQKGLQNIVDRYALIANEQVEIRKDENYFTVKIPLLP